MSSQPTSEPDPDEEALSWAGDEERGLRPAPRARGASAESMADATGFPDVRDDAPDLPGPTDVRAAPGRSAVTVLFAVLYAAIVLGWIVSVQRTSSGSGDLFVEVTWQFGEFLAMAAGALWFGTVHVLTRASRTLVRAAWWTLGVLILIPWPVVLVLLAEASA